MAAILDGLDALAARPGQLSDEVASLAAQVRQSVALIRGPRGGAGSGVVWDEHGLVVTNHHVTPDAWATVVVGNGAPLRARVVARAAQQDVAVLQVEGDLYGQGAIAATIGDSTQVRVGDVVVAVGNPLGERNAVTLGVVGGLPAAEDTGGGSEALRVAITLRPGNSGGALADVRGRVVGIPHMVVGSGLALAVPSHVVARVLREQRTGRPALGIAGRVVELPAALVARHGLAAPVGFVVLSVAEGSIAERAGLLLGDVVTLPGPALARGAGAMALLAQLEAVASGALDRLPVLRGGAAHRIEVLAQAA